MDYSHFMVCGLLGGGPALAIYFLLGAKRRASIPPLGWWLSLLLGAIIGFFGMSHSSVPSLAPRIIATGTAYDYVERETHSGYHHDTIYGFQFAPEDGKPIHIETEIILPDSALPRFSMDELFESCISPTARES
jgi:hypothetical protein